MILPFLLAGALIYGAPRPEPVRLVREIQVAIDRDGGWEVEHTWRRALSQRPHDPDAILAVATFERARYRFERADSLFQLLTSVAGDTAPTWRAMSQLGMAQWRSLGSGPAQADSLFSAARASAQVAGSRLIESEAVLGLAQLRQRSRGVKVGQALVAEWWGLLDRPTLQDSAQRLCLTGAADEQLGDTTGVRRIQAGAAIAERAAAWRVAGSCQLAIAQSAERRGYFAGAAGSAQRALQYYARIHYDLGTALASQWYGYSQLRNGRFAESRVLLELAITSARATRFESVEAWAHSGLAELYLSLGDLGQARQHAAIAADSHAARGDGWGLAVSRRFEAQALEASADLPGASAKYAEAHAAFVAAGLPLNALPALTARANVMLRLGQLDEAEQTIATAATLGRSSEAWTAEQAVLRAGLALRRGQVALADSILHSTRMSRDWRRGSTRLVAVVVAAREAQVALRRDRLVVAESALAAVTGAIDNWRRRPMNAGYTSALAQLRDNWGGLSDVYPDLIAQLAAQGQASRAFEFVERIRARDIVERALRSAALITDSSAAVRALRASRHVNQVVTLAELKRNLSADEALVSYTLGIDDAPTTAIIVWRDSVVIRSMPGRSALIADIQRFVQLAAAGVENASSGARLGAALLAPVFDAVPSTVTRLLLSPDGELHRVPFDALSLADGRFAIERAAISIAPSATALLALRARPAAPGTLLVAVGDPQYAAPADVRAGPSPGMRASAFGGFTNVKLPRLRYSGDEARRVSRYGAPGRVLLGSAASEDAVVRVDWSQVAVIHFAVHALVNEDSQVGTALALAPGRITDGFLAPGDLAQLGLASPLVVLSACHSSGGQVLGGEGMRGLTAPLLEAGARVVVATHWSIGDRSVVPFVDRFYSAMAAGARVDDAMRQAKLSAIHEGVSIADWGSYSIIGDGAMRPPLRRPALSPVAWLRNITQSRRDTSGS